MASIPEQMTVIEIAAPGGPEQLKLARRPTPKPGEGEVLVRVAAAGVNRPDVMQRQGKYPPPPGASDCHAPPTARHPPPPSRTQPPRPATFPPCNLPA